VSASIEANSAAPFERIYNFGTPVELRQHLVECPVSPQAWCLLEGVGTPRLIMPKLGR
jgi:hypothetical protein